MSISMETLLLAKKIAGKSGGGTGSGSGSTERTAWYRPPDWPDYSTIEVIEGETYITIDTHIEDPTVEPRLWLTGGGYRLEYGVIKDGKFEVLRDYGNGTLHAHDVPMPDGEGRFRVFRITNGMPYVHYQSTDGGARKYSECRIVEVYSNALVSSDTLITPYTELYTEKGVTNINCGQEHSQLQYVNCSDATSKRTDLYQVMNSVPNLRYVVLPKMTSEIQYFPYNCQKLMYLDMSNVTADNITTLHNFCRDCKLLTTLNMSGFDLSAVTIVTYLFDNCYNLVNLILDGTTMPSVSFSLSDSTRLSIDSLVGVIAALPTLEDGTTATLTLGSTNTAKLTAEQLAVATEKGWTVA